MIQGISKEITIKYSNSDNHNKEDEEYINNVQIVNNDYFVLDLDYWKKDEEAAQEGNEQEYSWNVRTNIVTDYYQKQFNDDSIVVKNIYGQGDYSGPFSTWCSFSMVVCKDQMIYRIIDCPSTDFIVDNYNDGVTFGFKFITQFNVPSNVQDSEINNYLATLIQDNMKYMPDNLVVTKVEQGTVQGVTNGYTVYYEQYDDEGGTTKIHEDTFPIVVNREKAISTTDTETNIKLDTTVDIVPAGTELIANKVTTGNTYNIAVSSLGDEVSNFVIYDIKLLNEGVKVQPNGKVKISLPIPTDYDKNNLIVYRVDENGNKRQYNTTVEENYAVFETYHFSIYVLAEKKAVDTDINIDNETPIINNTSNNELDETPKTGEEINKTILIYIILIISLVGVIILTKF